MRNRIDIDHLHSRAICREIGERLQAYLEPEPGLPAHLRKQVNRFCELEGQSPSIVPDVEHRLGNEPGSHVSRGDRSRLAWPWRRKNVALADRLIALIRSSGTQRGPPVR